MQCSNKRTELKLQLEHKIIKHMMSHDGSSSSYIKANYMKFAKQGLNLHCGNNKQNDYLILLVLNSYSAKMGPLIVKDDKYKMLVVQLCGLVLLFLL